MCLFGVYSTQPGKAKPWGSTQPHGADSLMPNENHKFGGKAILGMFCCCSNEFKSFQAKAANSNTFYTMSPHAFLLPESSVGEVFNFLLAFYQ